VIWLWLACSSASADRATYRASLEQPDATKAAESCLAISEESLRGDCQTTAAVRLAHASRFTSATAVCDAIDHPMWKEECWFHAADEAGALGAEAVDACRHAGRYRENCLGHAIGREVPRIEERFAKPGDELQLHDAVRDLVARYKPNAPEDQREATVERMVGQILSKRWEGQPFDASRCGQIAPDLCRLAYRMNLDAAPPEVPLERICKDGPTLERVTASNAPAWAPGSDAMAAQVWTELCADLTSGKVARDARHSMGVPPIGAPAPAPDHIPGEPQKER
jgi:hypothetical protein